MRSSLAGEQRKSESQRRHHVEDLIILLLAMKKFHDRDMVMLYTISEVGSVMVEATQATRYLVYCDVIYRIYPILLI
jgi:hypothetical protein